MCDRSSAPSRCVRWSSPRCKRRRMTRLLRQRMQIYRTKDAEVTEEAEAARKLIVSIMKDTSTPSDNVALALIDGRIEAAVTDVRRLMNEENSRLISQLEAHDFPEVQRSLKRIDVLRDEFNQRIDQIRADMLAQVLRQCCNGYGRSAAGDLDHGHCHCHSRDLGIPVCRLGRHRDHAPGPVVAARHTRGRGGPARSIHRCRHQR